MKTLLIAIGIATLAACSPPRAGAPALQPIVPVSTTAPAGDYTLDKAHASLIFRVDHLGFSHFTGRFTHWDAHLALDPAHPDTSHIDVAIDPASLESDNPPAGFMDQLDGPQFLDAPHFPEMSFRSTHVELTSPNSARIAGDMTMHGVTRPVTLEATFNGGYAGHPLDPHARIGFSAHGSLKRSDFGIAFGIPPAGSTMGVGDEVQFEIECEFSGPAWSGSPAH